MRKYLLSLGAVTTTAAIATGGAVAGAQTNKTSAVTTLNPETMLEDYYRGEQVASTSLFEKEAVKVEFVLSDRVLANIGNEYVEAVRNNEKALSNFGELDALQTRQTFNLISPLISLKSELMSGEIPYVEFTIRSLGEKPTTFYVDANNYGQKLTEISSYLLPYIYQAWDQATSLSK